MVYYEPIPASDGTSLTAPSNAEFRVFEVSDTARANPVELRTVAGTNAAPLTTTAQGVLPGVEVVSPNFSHIFKSGEWEWRRDSVEGIRKEVEAAQTSSATSARAAAEAVEKATMPADQAVAAGIARADIPGTVAKAVAAQPTVAAAAAAAVNASPKIEKLDAESARVLVYGDAPVPGAYVPDAATRGQWSFEQTLGDSSGGNWVLKQYSTFSGSFAQPGRFGSHSLGGGIYQSLGVDHVLSSTGADNGTLLNGTVECWIKTAKPTALKVAVSHTNWYWLGVTLEGKATARYGFGNTEKPLNGTTVLHGADLTSAPWHHLALVFKNGVASLYVNGKLEDTNTATAGTRPDPDGGFTIGGLRSARTYDWWNSPGLIDEVRVSSTPRYPSYPPRPTGLRRGGALFIGPTVPSERQPFDQWIRTETA